MADVRRADPDARTEAAPLAPGDVPSLSADEAPSLVANRYELLGMLGAGAMGTVYRARDRELDEIVALKVLKKELASSAGMLERFRREVKLARRVTHRNVARTFDIGDHDGDRFLTMELIDGEMLGAHLARRGRVPCREVLTIARDICAGLAVAHAAGVLHRDLKPENVVLARDGRAVITDFGIARAVAQGELGRTQGGIVGTPAYMAPEQVEGRTDLDGRADLYALGTMLFELLTGKPAWPGDSVIAIAAARVLRPPPDVREHVPDLPAALADVVLKLMARAREDRYASAEETAAALLALATTEMPSTRSLPPPDDRAPRPTATVRTVAVLPLLNLGADDDAYLTETVTEDLVDLLSVVPQLRVRPRGETARYGTHSRDVREAGRVLGVDVVVDGSIRRIDDIARVAIRLVTVEDGFQLWARRFDRRPPAAVLSVADEAASAIARALAAERTAEARPAEGGDPVAQDLYLRGRYLVHHGWFSMSRDGVALLQQAHERAPDDPRIAGTYALAVARVLTGDPDSFALTARAREIATHVLEGHPGQVEAHVALAFLHLNDGEGAACAVQLKRALSLSPNAVEVLDVAGRVLVEVGRTELGLATLRKALAKDPGLLQAKQSLHRAYVLMGDLESAEEVIGPESSPGPTDAVALFFSRARMVMWHGDVDAANAIERHAPDTRHLEDPATPWIEGLLHVVRTKALSPEFARYLEVSLGFDKRFSPRRIAFHAQVRTEVKVAVGDIDGAMADLRVADLNGLLDLLWLDRCPLFDRVRSRSDFLAVRESTAARAERVIRVLDPD